MSLRQGKEYFQNYYKNHKKEYAKRNQKRRSPRQIEKINQKYIEKYAGKRKKSINKSNYGKPLKDLFIKHYGSDLENKVDDATHTLHKKRMICVDCLLYNSKECPGWENCPYKQKILQVINK